MRRWSLVCTPAFAALAALLAGCASGEPPTAKLAVAGTTLSDAQSAGAVQHAPVELKLAREELAAAQAAARDEDYGRAARLADEAQADAKLAEVKTRASLAQQSASAVRQDASTLRRELGPSEATPSANGPSGAR